MKGYQAVLFGVAIGLLLFGIYKITMKAVVRNKIRRAKEEHPEASAYVEKVERF